MHTCHAKNCKVVTPPKMLMCRRHWYLVPKALRDRVWATYQTGQEVGRVRPSREYFAAVREAIDAVEQAEADAASKKTQGELFT